MIKNKTQAMYVISTERGEFIDSMISTDIDKVLNAIKLDVLDFCLNHPNCSNKQALKDFLGIETEEEINISSREGDSFVKIYKEGDYLNINFFDIGEEEPKRYAIQTHYVSRN